MKLTILNLNAWLLPLRVSIDNTRRVHQIFEIIDTLKPDVITFQEVWDVSYLKYFAEKMPHYYMLCNPNNLFNESGLITFSKHPIIANKLYHFMPNSKYRFFEKKSKKGFMVTRIDLNGKEVDIVNTHLHQSDIFSSEQYRVITKKQYFCIEDFFKKSKHATILCGDLNIPYQELITLSKTFKIPQTRPLPTLAKINRYANSRLNKTRIPERQLDYLLYLENGMSMDVKIKVLNKEIVSDHYPLYSEVVFN
jgi:endonuclease/exonuclease/phosphatase family metal-dependent hydrolase